MNQIAQPEDILEQVFGYPAFRHNQSEIIEHLLAGKDAMVLMPTGGGKSLCYQVPALCLEGVTIVVSPLIALMKDQVDALLLNGVKAAFLNSTQHVSEQQAILEQLKRNELKLLYIAPERLVGADMNFLQFLKDQVQVSLFAIDEAHCISQWGHDFRPEYRVLKQLKQQFAAIPVIALTATADALTRDDIIAELQLTDYRLFENSFNRPNIAYHVRPKQQYYGELVDYLSAHQEESGIIYCLSRASTEQLANDLAADGFSAAAYHAGLDKSVREQRQDLFLKDDIRIMVATIAFGMGINKSNVRFVVHVDLPKNIEGYYQETGRAGRDGLPSEAILFYGTRDVQKLKSFAQVEDNPEQTKVLLDKLEQMVRLCETRKCRRQFLLQYFGETAPPYCGNCDTCMHQPVLTDQTVVAQKILSTVARVEERFGMGYVTEVLRGSNSAKIKPDHKQLSVYGIGKDKPKEEWLHYAKQLVQDGYLALTDGTYPIVQLTPKSKTVLFGGEKVWLPAPVQLQLNREVTVYQQHPYEQALFEALKQRRNRLAHEENVPAYIILSDSTLMDLATYLPLRMEDLSKISGMGVYKVQHYGELFLAEVQQYCGEHGFDTRMHLKPEKREKKPRVIRERETDTKTITLGMYEQGMDLSEIAVARGLSLSTIENHLSYYIGTGRLSIDAFVQASQRQLIEAAIQQTGTERLKLLKEQLPDNISYGQIRMTIAYVVKQ